MSFNILLMKETRAGEQRVALVPDDVKALIAKGHDVSVERAAGLGAGFDDAAYKKVGATVIDIDETSIESMQASLQGVDVIVRAKRPNRQREIIEAKAFKSGSVMIGALDPFELDSCHIDEYHTAGIIAYSIDQADLPNTDPMNILAAMSRIAGMLAFQDAVSKCQHTVKKTVIMGLGEVGRAALAESQAQQIPVIVVVPNEQRAAEVVALGAIPYLVSRELDLAAQQALIKQLVSDADIVITSARKPNQPAPLLIPDSTLSAMKSGTVIVDMAISEGGNVAGSHHDETICTDKGVLITNVSGYPKAVPHEASLLWSRATALFILQLAKDATAVKLQPC